jgi:hypothetical protein
VQRRRSHWFLVFSLLLVGHVYAFITAITYTVDLNQGGGHDVAAGQRNLPGGTINVTCDSGPSLVTLFNQLGFNDPDPLQDPGVIGQFGAPCGADVVSPDPVTTNRLLFEGRTQILTQGVDGDGVPFLGPIGLGGNAADPYYFDVDTGPPAHPVLDIVDVDAFQTTNTAAQLDLVLRQVIFNREASLLDDFLLTIQGRVVNIPILGPPVGEVGATLSVEVARQGGGPTPARPGTPTVPAGPSVMSTFTGPYLIPFQLPIVKDPGNPSFNGVADEEGAWAMATDWTTMPDGYYDLRYQVRDVQGNRNPNDGQNLTVLVLIDRENPTVAFREPPQPFIINGLGHGPFCEDPLFALSGQVSDNLTGISAVLLESFANDAGAANPFSSITTLTTTAPFSGFFSVDYDLTTAPIIPGPDEQILYATTVNATDEAGNPSNEDLHLVIWDQVPTEPPSFSTPPDLFTTNASTITFSGAVANLRPGDENLEEHGTVDFLLTLISSFNPSDRTTFVIAGDPALILHDSELDTVVSPAPFPFVTGDDPLGDVPDLFTFNRVVDFTTLPDGDYTVELGTFDQACNRSTLVTQTLCIGRIGPVISVDLGQSGPDDNYNHPDNIPGRPPNQFGADDPVFVISLRSPERPDPGNPPTGTPVGFPPPPADFDPGTADRLMLRGIVTDPCTTLNEVRASGPNIPTTVFTVTTNTHSSTFALGAVDVTKLQEGIPELVSLVAVNSFGQEGPTTNVIVIRDVIPGRAPLIAAPQQQPFFTNADTLDFDGTAEPNAVVALLLPPTTGASVNPIDRTTNGNQVDLPRIPNPSSLFNSIPISAVTTLTRSDGRFSFRNVSLVHVDSGLTTPVRLLLQTIDQYDNTDPVISVTPFEIFRTTGVGSLLQVVLDHGTLREQAIFPASPTPPVTPGEFRGEELVDIELLYDTFVVDAPEVRVTQSGGALGKLASLVVPSNGSRISTSTLVFRYPVTRTEANFDGPVLIEISGGRDIFGNDPGAVSIGDSFYVDTVAPVFVTTGTISSPGDVQRINQVSPLLQVALEDVPATGVTTSSGLDLLASELRLLGPLELNPEPEVALARSTATTGFDLAFTPVAPLTQDGTYRILVTAVDSVGNRRELHRTFILDRSPVAAPSIVHNPECGSFVNVFPEVGGVQAVTAQIQDPTLDLNASTIQLFNSEGGLVPITQGTILPSTLAAFPTPVLTGDGSADDLYTVLLDLTDLAGNPTPQVTCTFTFDTTAPSLALPFPTTGACVNDPLRLVQVALADPPSLLSTSIFSSGMDLDRSQVEVFLEEPSWPNVTRPETQIPSKVSYRTTPGTTIEAVLAEFLDAEGLVRSLNRDGSEDGIYRIETLAIDHAGNAVTHLSTFSYDTQEPQVNLTDFPDPSSLAGAEFTVSGEALDLGPCGFGHPAAPGGALAVDRVQVRVIERDLLDRPILPPQAPFYDFVPAAQVTDVTTGVFQGVSQRASFTATGVVPALVGARALLQIKVTDSAGNSSLIQRHLDVSSGVLPAPVPLTPGNGDFVNAKVLRFRWQPVITARRYDLEIERVTPTTLTTSTTIPLDFPTDAADVDLNLIAAQVAGGSPLTTTSNFQWRIRGIDVTGNLGGFSAFSTFVLDPVPPEVTDVLVGGTSVSAGGTLVGGVNTLDLPFIEDGGLDPAVPPEIFLRFRDTRIPEVQLPVTVTGTNSAQTSLELLPLAIGMDPNGTATLVVRGGRDLAGNLMTQREFSVEVDIGPFVDLRLAPNPVAPRELLLAMVTRSFEGGPPESIPFVGSGTLNPILQARQQGRPDFEVVSVNPVQGTTPTSSAFFGHYRIDEHLHGLVDFSTVVTDLQGRQSARAFSVGVGVEALLKEGLVFQSVVDFSGMQFQSHSLKAGTRVFAMRSDLAASPNPEPAPELVPVQDLGAYLSAQEDLDAPARVIGQVEASRLGEIPPEKLAIYRAQEGGWEHLPSRWEDGKLVASTRGFGTFAVMADLAPPRAEEGEEEGTVHLTDLGAGVDPVSVVFHGVASKPVPGIFDSSTGLAQPDPAFRLRSGRRTVEVEVQDRSGNRSMTRLGLTIAGPPDILEAVVTPNPVRVGPARLRYRLAAAGTRARVEVFDASGRRLAILPGTAQAGLNEVRWDLRARRGRAANGIYFLRLRVEGSGAVRRATAKLALLR